MAETTPRVVIIGAGFTGLAAGYEMSRRGLDVTILELETAEGGLAASFDVGGQPLERFYHHWFTNDRDVVELISSSGCETRLCIGPRARACSTPEAFSA